MNKLQLYFFLLLCFLLPLNAYCQSAEEFYNKGLTASALKYYQLAITYYTQAINLKPGYEDAYLNRGAARYRLADCKGALADYDSITHFNTRNALAIAGRGMVKVCLGDTVAALADYELAIAIDPN